MLSSKTVKLKVLLNVIVGILFAVSGIASCGGAGGSLVSSASANLSANPLNLSPSSNLMGINIGPPDDYWGDRLYADVMKVARDFTIPGTSTPVPVDANGWPMSDFSFYVWAGIDKMNGTYTLTFKGQAANVKGTPVGNIPVTYDPATNTSTGTFNYTPTDSNFLVLDFTGTKRTSSSALGSGVTLMKLMRPLTPGSSQSYPSSTLFNAPLKALISKFSTIRFMDFLRTNANTQTNWSDRPLPTWASFQRNPGGVGIGGPWEHVIQLANETRKDAWINIPINATDAYIKNVALMFAYGSDGVNPYTSPQANPVYPPLNANLRCMLNTVMRSGILEVPLRNSEIIAKLQVMSWLIPLETRHLIGTNPGIALSLIAQGQIAAGIGACVTGIPPSVVWRSATFSVQYSAAIWVRASGQC
jgi:hypothetical protein